ncbi:MAG: tyrosine-protein phosphatase [Frankia sp.]
MTERWIELEGCDNARDLGGLPTVDGRTTRRGVFLRTDSVQHLTPTDVAWLRESYGLRTVLDLRTPKEAAAHGRGGLGLEAIGYHNIPFVPDEYLDPNDPRHDIVIRARVDRNQSEDYLDYLTRGSNVAAALRVATSATRTPLLFHCAAGKDRTGVLAALILDLVGVERDAIAADYVATNERAQRIIARLMTIPMYAAAAKAASESKRDVGCRADTITSLLAAIDDGFGGTAGWAVSAGIPEPDLARLRDRLVVG